MNRYTESEIKTWLRQVAPELLPHARLITSQLVQAFEAGVRNERYGPAHCGELVSNHPMYKHLEAKLAEAEAKIKEQADEIAVDDQLLNGRDQLLEAIPKCEAHGNCIPHAVEWIKRHVQADAFLRAELADLEQNEPRLLYSKRQRLARLRELLGIAPRSTNDENRSGHADVDPLFAMLRRNSGSRLMIYYQHEPHPRVEIKVRNYDADSDYVKEQQVSISDQCLTQRATETADPALIREIDKAFQSLNRAPARRSQE